MSTIKPFRPLVSIVIPVFNGARFIRDAINSALAQTYGHIEVIVVNDGSEDDTHRISTSYGQKIRYFSKSNGGVSSALNMAISESRGSYISWLSHDDIYVPDKLKVQIQQLALLKDKEREQTILWGNFETIDAESQLILQHDFRNQHELPKLNIPLYPLFHGLIHGCTLLIPRQVFEKTNGFDEKLLATQDYDLWFRMFQTCQLLFSPVVMVKSRKHDEQSSRTLTCREAELEQLWMKMVTGVTDEQKIAIGDSLPGFSKSVLDSVSRTRRSRKVENFLKRQIEEYLDPENTERPRIVANLATYPLREANLERCIDSIAGQVDQLNIYLNGYETVPEHLLRPRVNPVLAGDALGDLKDNGKFFFLGETSADSYYLTIDDDIVYPDDYVIELITKIEKYHRKAIVGVHGTVFHEHFTSFRTSRTTVHFMAPLEKDLAVSMLGTGTVAFHRGILTDLSLKDFPSMGLADLWLAARCKNQQIRFFCIARRKGWLTPINLGQGPSLWKRTAKNETRQNRLVLKNSLWQFDERSRQSYRAFLEHQIRSKSSIKPAQATVKAPVKAGKH